jgi:N-acetylglucosamine kinase
VAFADDGQQLREVHRERIATPGTDFAAFVAAMQGLIARGDEALGLRAPVGIGLPGVIDSVSGRQLSSNVPALNGRLVVQSLQEACSARSPSATTASASPCPKHRAAQPMAAQHVRRHHRHRRRRRLLRQRPAAARLNGVAGEWGHWPLAAAAAAHGLPLLDCPAAAAAAWSAMCPAPA